jgi:hypothetical protein
MRGNDRKGKDDAEVDDERNDEKLRFVGGGQDSERIQKTAGRRQELSNLDIWHLTFFICHWGFK